MCFKILLSNCARTTAEKAKVVGNKDNIYTISKAGFNPINNALVSKHADTCCLVGLNAGKNNCLIHIAPEQQPLCSIQDGLEKCILKLQEKYGVAKDKITAILVGGRELIQKDAESVASFNNYNTVANSLDNLEIPFTMICGKKKGATKDNIYMVNETATIWNDFFKDLKLNKNSTQEEITEELSKKYQFVEIAPEVPVSIAP